MFNFHILHLFTIIIEKEEQRFFYNIKTDYLLEEPDMRFFHNVITDRKGSEFIEYGKPYLEYSNVTYK